MDMQNMQGLLGGPGGAMGGGMPQQGGGLLGPGPQQAPQPPQGGQQGPGLAQLAQQLAAQPSMEVAQAMSQHLQQSGNPAAGDFAQEVQKTGGDPGRLKQLAMEILTELSGGQ